MDVFDRKLLEYKKECIMRGFGKHSIESYLSCIKIFHNYVSIDLELVDQEHLTHFLYYLRHEREVVVGGRIKTGATKSTIKTYYAALHSFYDFLEYKGTIQYNPVPKFRKRYLRHIKKEYGPENTRQIISVAQMAKLIYSTTDPLERAIIMVLAKSGIRRNELISLDIEDVLSDGTIHLKKTAKRSNRTVFIDTEGWGVLSDYLSTRLAPSSEPALFVYKGHRISRNYVYRVVTINAMEIGLHNPHGLMNQKFTPHCCRHFFTTVVRRNGLSREFRQALRGDVIKDAVDIYDHIEISELHNAYIETMPNFKDSIKGYGTFQQKLDEISKQQNSDPSERPRT